MSYLLSFLHQETTGRQTRVPQERELDRAIEYLREHREVRDVILSGGDPLLLPDHLLERILKALRTIPHLELIRIGSRVPGSLPERITPKLCEMVKRYHPIYMNLHFNHPDELTPAVKAACGMLADAGIPLGAQTVLLKDVNDDPETMKRLVHQLLLARVKPYYLYQADLTKGTNHFRTTVETGLNIIKALQGHTSGMAVPHFVIDAPGGGGKIPLLPDDYLVHLDEDGALLRNYENKSFSILSRRLSRDENCRWSAPDPRVRPRMRKPMRPAVTATLIATASLRGETAAAESRTTCDDTVPPVRHSPLSRHQAADREPRRYVFADDRRTTTSTGQP